MIMFCRFWLPENLPTLSTLSKKEVRCEMTFLGSGLGVLNCSFSAFSIAVYHSSSVISRYAVRCFLRVLRIEEERLMGVDVPERVR